MNEARHTPGAIRAAEAITGGKYGDVYRYPTTRGDKTVAGVADLIDSETSRQGADRCKIYLRLFHGRTSPDEELDDWGRDGPIFPLDYFHMTYLTRFNVGVDADKDSLDLLFVEDMAYYDGIYYGDISLWTPDETQRNSDWFREHVQKFDPAKAIPPTSGDEDATVEADDGLDTQGGYDDGHDDDCRDKDLIVALETEITMARNALPEKTNDAVLSELKKHIHCSDIEGMAIINAANAHETDELEAALAVSRAFDRADQ